MTLVLDLPQSVEAEIARRAAQQGTTPEGLVLADLSRLYPSENEAGAAENLSPKERVQRFLAWTDGHDRSTPVIPLEAFDREHLYADEDA